MLWTGVCNTEVPISTQSPQAKQLLCISHKNPINFHSVLSVATLKIRPSLLGHSETEARPIYYAVSLSLWGILGYLLLLWTVTTSKQKCRATILLSGSRVSGAFRERSFPFVTPTETDSFLHLSKKKEKMKFMKLGSKPDVFQADGKSVRYVTAELASDVTIIVDDIKFFLHKFPLLSKSRHLQKLVSNIQNENSDEINLPNFPGGSKAFEVCAKFCYNVTVTLNPYNVVAARCAAEYLEMTEDGERGSLVFKIEVFLNSSIFRSWKDSIIVLQTTKYLLPWSEDLNIIGRCVDSIASKTSVDPTNVTWSYTYNRKISAMYGIVEEGRKFPEAVPKDWWVEDICELEIEFYKLVMISVKSKGRMSGGVISEALRAYATRWLPDSIDSLESESHKSLVETIISLMPPDTDQGCPCSFLLKLLKVAIFVEADDLLKEVVMKKASLKLHEASVNDLLIPARSPDQATVYDVELVMSLLKQHLLLQGKGSLGIMHEAEDDIDFAFDPQLLLSLGRLIDGYLGKVASDPNMALPSFVEIARMIPDSARPVHDTLYEAIDIFLKDHPNMTKSEKKKICGLMDVKKLTGNAAMHAAQNERLPLRIVVQVLYFEQVRVAARSTTATTTTTEEESDRVSSLESCRSLKKEICQIKVEEDQESLKKGKLVKKNSRNSRSGIQLLPSRSRRIFDKLWMVGKGLGGGGGENKSSETSGSSQSPISIVPGDNKSSGSSTRHRRHSIS